jgi:hypothetical protein
VGKSLKTEGWGVFACIVETILCGEEQYVKGLYGCHVDNKSAKGRGG